MAISKKAEREKDLQRRALRASIPAAERCPRCSGLGSIYTGESRWPFYKCVRCGGTGRRPAPEAKA